MIRRPNFDPFAAPPRSLIPFPRPPAIPQAPLSPLAALAATRPRKAFFITQNNVAHTGPAHDAALAAGFEAEAEVILIQEPWFNDDRTKTHPAFHTFMPSNSWANRDAGPRVITYIRKGKYLASALPPPSLAHPNLCLAVRYRGITIINTYRRRVRGDNAALDLLEALTEWHPPRSAIIAGDFNAHHRDWDPDGPQDGVGNMLAQWTSTHNMSLVSEPGITTHTP